MTVPSVTPSCSAISRLRRPVRTKPISWRSRGVSATRPPAAGALASCLARSVSSGSIQVAAVADVVEAVEQISGIRILEHDALHLQRFRLEQRRIVDRRSQQDDPAAAVFELGRPDAAKHVHAVAARHLQVEQQDVRAEPLDFAQGRLAGAGDADDLEFGVAQQRLERGADHRMIVGERGCGSSAPSADRERDRNFGHAHAARHVERSAGLLDPLLQRTAAYPAARCAGASASRH